MSKRVSIIGAGQLGSRHLQGIAKSKVDIDIEVVDPFETSLEVAKERYNATEDNHRVQSINFFKNVDSLSNEQDVVIVATAADVRFRIVKELLQKKRVKNLVLEKILFQTIDEYYEIEDILKKNNTKCWVNHTRRMLPVYRELKAKVADAKEIHYNFQCGNWGMGCNALHFIDHLAYMVDSTNLTIDTTGLNKKIYDAKRKGFIEFNGLLTGSIDNHKFSLYSGEETFPAMHTISSDILLAKIDEGKGELSIAEKKNNWEWKTITKKIIYFQSELSNVLIEDILINNICHLPTYTESMKLHIPFIEGLLKHMNSIDSKVHTKCPIT